MLDTHACELCFVKNGRLLEQRYPVSLGGGMYFAVGRYYGSYVVRCLYMQQQVDIDEETNPSPNPRPTLALARALTLALALALALALT